MEQVRIFCGNGEVQAVDPADRGLAYGDGLFETMRVHAGSVPWLYRHWQRLMRGARRLQLHLPPMQEVSRIIGEMFADGEDGVAKLIVTRGASGRGYSLPAQPQSTWIVSRHPLPPTLNDGLVLHLCRTRYSRHSTLAGIKHCNRLEQILARAESDAAGVDEGLMRDPDGRAISATSANLLIQRHKQWFTPSLEHCGVAGVVREWLLEQGLALEAEISMEELQAADAVALCNAIHGIMPVLRIGKHAFASQSAAANLQHLLAGAHSGFRKGVPA